MATEEAAKQAVARIARKYGCLSEEMMESIGQWNPNYRREIEENWLAIESMAAHSIKTLAKQIYGSGARFVFELLQNADDNKFTRAVAQNDPPYISFAVFHDRVVVECNEDGFSEQDLEAICAVGQSTKSSSNGFIGAKGIGFKSVFIAASRVDIQSGHFSFYFRHEKGDSGLGMVIPRWQKPQHTLSGPLTRITLHLHAKGNPVVVDHLRHTILQQFNDLQETSLLFLNNLRQIRVAIHDADDGLIESKEFKVAQLERYRYSLSTTVSSPTGEQKESSKYYHVTKYRATGLALSENRDPPKNEEARRVASTAQIVLAFPLTHDSKPVIEKQHLFAFLPVRESDFKFVVHSDFDTTAHRQDILTTSKRNMDIRSSIASVFIQSVIKLCEHPELCYSWPSFLPLPHEGTSPFWTSLVLDIKARVFAASLFKSRNRTGLRPLAELYRLTSDSMDENKEPLLNDPSTDPYLSKNYTAANEQVLLSFGLRNISGEVFFGMMRSDLNSPTSKMKEKTTTQQWHSATAKLCLRGLQAKKAVVNMIKEMPLLPFRDGTWHSPKAPIIFLPTYNGHAIPLGTSLPLLDPVAVANSDRLGLFLALGAKEPPLRTVRDAILSSISSGRDIAVEEAKAFLHFLYLTHGDELSPSTDPGSFSFTLDPKPNRFSFKWGQTTKFVVHGNDGSVVDPKGIDVYLETGSEYGPDTLLKAVDGAPGFNAIFLHPEYSRDVPKKPQHDYPSWEEWLTEMVGIRSHIRLVSPDETDLSEALKYVAAHRPKALLGLLEHLWRMPDIFPLTNSRLKALIAELPVSKLGGTSDTDTLGNMWLPLPYLRKQVEKYLEIPTAFPFLDMQVEDPMQFAAKWGFLNTFFGVKFKDDISFLFAVLASVQGSSLSDKGMRDLCSVYVAIDLKHSLSRYSQASEDLIRDHFQETCAIMFLDDGEGIWANSQDCIWKGPPNMLSKYSLRHFYKEITDSAQFPLLAHFFQSSLAIPDATWRDIVDELLFVKECKIDDYDYIKTLYQYLDDTLIKDNHSDLSDAFEQNEIIFAIQNGKPGWYKASACLWSSTTDIRGKATINDHYEGLESFFVGILGVRSLTLQMVYDELLEGSRKSIEEIKSALRSFSSLLRSDPTHLDRAPLLKASVFPIKYPDGSTKLQSADTSFAIVDRQDLGSKFASKIKLLDFSLEEVRYLKPFFKWLNMEGRCLSNCVRQITSVWGGNQRPITVPQRDLKRKAHALLRISATFGMPRYKADPTAFYQLLKSVNVIETDDISTTWIVSQDGHSIEVPEKAGNQHIAETSSGVSVYVPRSKGKQALCFSSTLPEALLDWLMRDPVTFIRDDQLPDDAIKALAAILTIDVLDKAVLHQVLVQHGIGDVDIANEDDSDDESDAESEQESGPTTPSQAGPCKRTPSQNNSPNYQGHSLKPRSGKESLDVESLHSTSRRHVKSDEDRAYLEILISIVKHARSADFPFLEGFNLGSLADALPDIGSASHSRNDLASKAWPRNQPDRQMRIGAAGELYVFVLLETLGVGIDVADWKSTLRHYASIHPEFTHLTQWSGRETADFVFEDSGGALTSRLVMNGYLNSEEWAGRQPRYFIEVKTTPGPRDTPFYVSKSQWCLMREKCNDNHYDEIYMILRVYWAGSERVSMEAYVDPCFLRAEGKLQFAEESWSVTRSTKIGK
ncbi:hypothetical protein B0I35DRAFT_459384 [Stachybotrys elegans]|uniref:Sacsin/Nov domain-containing protein n=1 Tax=Stachybotrys elegans TaxID=80388 RepID=A0A8K0STF8_9HYPO|nr:hypothetical protein B0I35DRAFT_459384 [Stachybotrys elegans]